LQIVIAVYKAHLQVNEKIEKRSVCVCARACVCVRERDLASFDQIWKHPNPMIGKSHWNSLRSSWYTLFRL